MVAVNGNPVDWAVAEMPIKGSPWSGDGYLVKPTLTGVLVVVVDGLGHGEPARATTERTLSALDECAEDATTSDLVLHCHQVLQNDRRGAVLSLAKYDAMQNLVAWLGVGNVEGRLLLRTSGGSYIQQSLLLRPGIVGGPQLPNLQPSVMRVRYGDLLIFATDGIAPDFADNIRIDAHVNDIAKHISENYRKQTDDELALVMRCLGNADAG